MATLTVTGRLGKDAEVRELQSGTKVASFSIADDVGWGDKKTTQWIKCAYFGARAEKLAPHLQKGGLVEVIGVPTTEAWIKKADGTAQAAISLTVLEVRLHGGGKRDDAEPAPKRGPHSDDTTNGDDDLPF